MDASVKTQFDIKNNVEDLQKYIAELKIWEAEIKEKEQALLDSTSPTSQKMAPPRNKIPKKEDKADNTSKEKKIAGFDYKAWDKFDADKACRDIDGEGEDFKVPFTSSDDDDDDECDLPPVRKPAAPPLKQVPKKPEKVSPKPEKIDKDKERSIATDLAFMEKEMGNKFVKEEKWEMAIECYSKAIKLDSSNAIYYANRALCHIKLCKFKEAEADSTVALQLDKTYLKAYQRRAFARKALNQYKEAKSDYEQILKLEPKNALARVEIDKINDCLAKGSETGSKPPAFNHRKMFAAADSALKRIEKTIKSKNEEKLAKSEPKKAPVKVDTVEHVQKKVESKVIFSKLPESCVAVESIKKLPHQRSKCPLKKISIKQVDHSLAMDDLLTISTSPERDLTLGSTGEATTEMAATKTASVEKMATSGIVVKPSDDKMASVEDEKPIVNKTPVNPGTSGGIETPSATSSSLGASAEISSTSKVYPKLPPPPQTSVQFELSWKSIYGNNDLCYQFLKSMNCGCLRSVFGSCLESWLVSQMVEVLSSDACMGDAAFQHDFLLGLSNVERFTSLALFLSPADHQGLTRICNNLAEHYSSEEIAQIKKLYDL